MQNSAIEIHDSVLDSISIADENAVLNFARVYIHQSPGRPLTDAGTVWVQSAQLLRRDAIIDGSFSDWPRDLLDGYISLNGSILDNEIPIPLNYTGEVELRLESWGEFVTIKGKAARLDFGDEREYVEEFQPARQDAS